MFYALVINRDLERWSLELELEVGSYYLVSHSKLKTEKHEVRVTNHFFESLSPDVIQLAQISARLSATFSKGPSGAASEFLAVCIHAQSAGTKPPDEFEYFRSKNSYHL